jgi:hypothetical protein
MEKISKMDDRELAGLELNLEEGGGDRASVITQDRLRKFNEIYGYDHGPAAAQLDD